MDTITATSGAGLDELVEGCGPDHPVQRALCDGAAAFANGLSRSILLRSRALWVDFSIWPNLFGETDALRRHIPWTRHASRGQTRGIEGQRVDLVSYVAENRERLVLKPTFGPGAVLGWRTDAATWTATLERALEEAWIVQERVPVTEALHPVLDGDQVRHEAVALDLAPFLWGDGRHGGFLARLSPAARFELEWGGSVTPLVVLRGRA
ncbi:hypothetical protein LY474_32875 [Myxococcus stipitatus]|uniref:hypothetical protein n=1 Tax=Myxococcus stipitatus TaxID=83455 RepID=UPI001F3381AC|nr:hypothetical protein [Myxococcus stipitatus]MCE9672612.1 hypothetical protein [Myxococcus stipitatus]